MRDAIKDLIEQFTGKSDFEGAYSDGVGVLQGFFVVHSGIDSVTPWPAKLYPYCYIEPTTYNYNAGQSGAGVQSLIIELGYQSPKNQPGQEFIRARGMQLVTWLRNIDKLRLPSIVRCNSDISIEFQLGEKGGQVMRYAVLTCNIIVRDWD